MKLITDRVLGATVKKLFRTKPIYKTEGPETEEAIASLESNLLCSIPVDLKYWYTNAGFGELNEQLSIYPSWTKALSRETTNGHIAFAQDELGNFYSFLDGRDEIYFLSRRTPEYGVIAESFEDFLRKIESKGFDVFKVVDACELGPRDWAT